MDADFIREAIEGKKCRYQNNYFCVLSSARMGETLKVTGRKGRLPWTARVIVCTLLLFHCMSSGYAFYHTRESTNDKLITPGNCSTNLRPNHDGPPVEVGVSMYVLDISSISEENMDFKLDLYFREHWTDPCLLPIEKTVTFSSMNIPPIWTPDTFFVNEKNSFLRPTSSRNEFFRIDNLGQVLHSKRLSVTASCPMDLHNFPMDKQQCKIDIESYGHTMKDITYKWIYGDESVGVSNGIMLPQFKILGHKLKFTEAEIASEKYSRLTVEFQFERFTGHYIMQIFIPSALIVLISFATFWINHRFISARITLSSITFISMLVLASNTLSSLPKASYLMATDVYLIGCFLMVCSTVIEGIAVFCKVRKIQMTNNLFPYLKKIMKMKYNETVDGSDNFCDKEVLNNMNEMNTAWKNADMLPTSMWDNDKPSMIDVTSCILFPITFLGFNLIFWIYYLLFN